LHDIGFERMSSASDSFEKNNFSVVLRSERVDRRATEGAGE